MVSDKREIKDNSTEGLEETITGHSAKIFMLFSLISNIFLLFYSPNRNPEKTNTTNNM